MTLWPDMRGGDVGRTVEIMLRFTLVALSGGGTQACKAEIRAHYARPTPTPGPALSPLPSGTTKPPEAIPQVSRSTEVRGVWMTNVDSSILNSAAALEKGFDQALTWGLNTVYPVVWNKGYTLYPSPVSERVVGSQIEPGRSPDWDMLSAAVELGKKRNIAVLPWFEYGLKVPSTSRIFKEKPDWLTRTRTGKMTRTDGIEFGYLNPAHPEVRAFLKELMVDLVRRYDVAGVQIDDHFSMWKEFGYDELTVQRYKEKTGKNPPENHEDKDFTQFRADQITALVAELSSAVRAVRSDLVFSVSPNSYPWSLVEHLQDWPAWVRQGAASEIVLQNYHIKFEQFEAELSKKDLVAAKAAIPYTAIGVLAGLSSRKVTAAELQRRISRARQTGYGVAFFFYESLLNIIPENESASQRTEALETGFQ